MDLEEVIECIKSQNYLVGVMVFLQTCSTEQLEELAKLVKKGDRTGKFVFAAERWKRKHA